MVLTEVVNDGNIQYLNPDDEDEPGTQLYVTQAGLNEKKKKIKQRLKLHCEVWRCLAKIK